MLFRYLLYLIGQIHKTSHNIIHSQAYYGLSTTTCPHVPLMASQYSNLTIPSHDKQGLNTCYKSTTMWKTSWGLSQWETHENPTTWTYVDMKEVLLAKERNSFHLTRKKLDYLHFKTFLKYDFAPKATIDSNTTQHMVIVFTAPRTIDLPDDGRVSLSLEILDYVTYAFIV